MNKNSVSCSSSNSLNQNSLNSSNQKSINSINQKSSSNSINLNLNSNNQKSSSLNQKSSSNNQKISSNNLNSNSKSSSVLFTSHQNNDNDNEDHQGNEKGQQQREENDENDDVNEEDNEKDEDNRDEDNEEEDESNFIEPLFQIALHIAQSSFTRTSKMQPTYTDKLTLYALYKQAINGDLNKKGSSSSSLSTLPKRPGVFDLLGRAKWDAWLARAGLSPIQAKKLYLENVLKILRAHRHSNEARSLIQLFSSYEAYNHHSSSVDHMSETESDSDSDSDSESEHLSTSVQEEEARKNDEEEGLSDEHETESESESGQGQGRKTEGDLESSGLYITPSQLPDPVVILSSHQVLSPGTTGSSKGSISEPSCDNSQNSSIVQGSPGDEGILAAGSERTFTEEQVQRLFNNSPVQVTSPDISMNSGDETASSPRSSQNTPPPPLNPDHTTQCSCNRGAHLDQKSINDLNLSIVHLQTLLANFESHLASFSSTSPQKPSPSPPSSLTNNNNENRIVKDKNNILSPLQFPTFSFARSAYTSFSLSNIFPRFFSSSFSSSSSSSLSLKGRLKFFFVDLSFFFLVLKLFKLFHQFKKNKKII